MENVLQKTTEGRNNYHAMGGGKHRWMEVLEKRSDMIGLGLGLAAIALIAGALVTVG